MLACFGLHEVFIKMLRVKMVSKTFDKNPWFLMGLLDTVRHIGMSI